MPAAMASSNRVSPRESRPVGPGPSLEGSKLLLLLAHLGHDAAKRRHEILRPPAAIEDRSPPDTPEVLYRTGVACQGSSRPGCAAGAQGAAPSSWYRRALA